MENETYTVTCKGTTEHLNDDNSVTKGKAADLTKTKVCTSMQEVYDTLEEFADIVTTTFKIPWTERDKRPFKTNHCHLGNMTFTSYDHSSKTLTKVKLRWRKNKVK